MKDNSGFLEFEEIESFIKDVMTNPQSVIDPFRFIGGSGSDKITVADVVNLCEGLPNRMAALFKGGRGLLPVVPVSGGRRPVGDLRQTLFGGRHDHVWRPAAGFGGADVRRPAVGERWSAGGRRRAAGGGR